MKSACFSLTQWFRCSRTWRVKKVCSFTDDLHWADRGTLWLLGHLLRQIRDERVLILGCYRETELARTHPLARALLDWNRERLTTRITLRRFDAGETNAQLSALLGEEVSGEFGLAVHRETEGNPFFVEEVLKALIEKGSVRRESGRWKRCDVGELVIPQSVKEAIGNRLDRVGDQTNEVLRVAAVLGKTFSFEELQAAADNVSEDALLDALDESVNAQLVVARGTIRLSLLTTRFAKCCMKKSTRFGAAGCTGMRRQDCNRAAATQPAPSSVWPITTFGRVITKMD